MIDDYQTDIKKPRENKAKAFQEKHGYSLTMSRLMEKYGCRTLEEYRAMRKENRKKAKASKPEKVVKKAPTPPPSQKKKK
jgi:hypothetical protein